MGNDKKIPTINATDLKSPLSKAKEIKIDSAKVQEWKKSLETKQPVSLDGKKTKQDLEKAAGKSNISLGPIPNNKPNVAVKQNGKSCKTFCREEGFHILPLRYSVTQGKAVTLSTNLGDNVKSVGITRSKYIVEMVDSGYIYQLVIRTSGKKEWWAYKVTPSGYLSLFPIQKPAPVSVPEFACKSANHNFAGSLITVPHNPKDIEKTTYILYSHVALTQRIIKKLEGNPEDFVNKGYWQKIDIATWKTGSQSQKHCLNNKNLKSSIDNISSFGGRINQAADKFNAQPQFFSSIALYDPIGITTKLNDYRNDAYIAVDDFLETKDKNGLSNQRKLDAVQRLETLKSSLAKSINQYHTSREMGTRTPIDGRLQGRLLTIEELSKAAQKKGDVQEVARLEKSKQEVLKQHADLMNKREDNKEIIIEEKTKADFKVCDDNLNFEEAENFKKIASPIVDTARNLANSRTQDHLNWINSASLLNALDLYDDSDLNNGCAFKAHVACLLFGMEGAIHSEKQLDEWIKKPQFERKNLFIRGLYSNQHEIQAKHNEMLKNPSDGTALGIKLLKVLTDFMKKMDSAWDEYARVQLRPDKLKGYSFFPESEKKIMLFVSNLSRAFFRLGIGTKAENVFVNALCKKLLYPQLGKLTEELRYNELFYAVNPDTFKKGETVGVSRTDAKIDSKLAKIEVEQSLDKLINDAKNKSAESAKKLKEILGKDMTDATNNYHQVRASGILIIIESFNLVYMFNSYDMKTLVAEKKVALFASITGLTALALDIFYGMAKALRETATQAMNKTANSAAIRGAANVQRGAIKFASGCLGAVTGGLSAVMDFQNFNKQLDKNGGSAKTLAIIYLIRGFASAFGSVMFGFLATITYLEPVLNYAQHKKCSPLLMKLGDNVIVKRLTTDAARAVLLRYVAWAGGIGLIMTVFEVAVYIYIELHKLETWCKTSTFRQNKNEKIMSEKDEAENYEALFV